MSMFNCPVCGKQNSIRFYHPETFDDDVIIFHKVGMGRGKGFQKISGFSLEEFPELRETLGNRVHRVSGFLNPHSKVDTKIDDLLRQLEEEKQKRIAAEEKLEELDLEMLIRKLGRSFGRSVSDLHTAVDEIIKWNEGLSESNQQFVSANQNLESTRNRLEQEKRNLESETVRLKNENNELNNIVHKWAEAYQKLETNYNKQNIEYSNALSIETNRRVQVEEYQEELDLDALLYKIQTETGFAFTNLHAGVDALIRTNKIHNQEKYQVIEFINKLLPDYYDSYDSLGDAVSAMYEYYEDSIEELSDD